MYCGEIVDRLLNEAHIVEVSFVCFVGLLLCAS